MDTNKTDRAARFNARLEANSRSLESQAAIARCNAENARLRARDAADEARLVLELKRVGLRDRPFVEDGRDEG